MVDSVQGYKDEVQEVLTTDLNGLPDNAFSAVSTAISGWNEVLCTLEAVLDSINLDQGASTLAFYFIPSIDGTNYPNWETGTDDSPSNEQYYAGSITFIEGVAQAHRQLRDRLNPPLGNFKVAVRNLCGEDLPATGNVLRIRNGVYSSQ